MKHLIVAAFLTLASCGYSQRGAELNGQVKRVTNVTPIICSDRQLVDVSLGIVRNGVGSMSSQDVWLQVEKEVHLDLLKSAAASGQIVKLTYDVKRFVFCGEEYRVTSVEILK